MAKIDVVIGTVCELISTQRSIRTCRKRYRVSEAWGSGPEDGTSSTGEADMTIRWAEVTEAEKVNLEAGVS